MTEQKNISYLNKNFLQYKASLIEFAKNYFPNTYTDFSEASPGTMFIEMSSYVVKNSLVDPMLILKSTHHKKAWKPTFENGSRTT